MPHVLLLRQLTSNLQVVELSRSSYPCLPRNTTACVSLSRMKSLRCCALCHASPVLLPLNVCVHPDTCVAKDVRSRVNVLLARSGISSP
jgi:hypothetical protein